MKSSLLYVQIFNSVTVCIHAGAFKSKHYGELNVLKTEDKEVQEHTKDPSTTTNITRNLSSTVTRVWEAVKPPRR